MKTRNYLFLALGLFLFFNISLSAQTLSVIDPTPNPGDSTVFNIELKPLVSKTKFNATQAFYKHLFIFGDGNFLFGESQEKANFNHQYGPPQSTSVQNYFARAYSNGAYSDPEEPPLTGAPPITPPISGSIITKTVVDSNRYLKILRNVQVKPGDPFVSILSVKNPSDQPFSGQLFFLYNGQLRTISTTEITKLPSFSNFQIRQNLFYRLDIGGAGTTYHYSKLGPVNTNYKGLLVNEISNLLPNDEIHYFIDLVGDTTMMDVFEATVKAEMDFAVVLGTFSEDNNYPVLTPDSLQQELTGLELNTFAAGLSGLIPDSIRFYNQNEDSSQTSDDSFSPQLGASFFLDYYKSTASLVKSHDPNFMIMEACACPAQSDRYQIFTTVQCENTGFGETNNIYMDIKLPAGVSADDVVITPIQYHPYGSPADQISMIKLSDDSIRWELLNFGIEGTPLHGVGDPRTFANVKFHMYSSVEPTTLDSIYACIRFDNLSNDPVCTVPVAVSLVGPGSQEGQVLQCTVGDCSDDPNSDTGWPWWLWLLLLLLAILILIWVIRRN